MVRAHLSIVFMPAMNPYLRVFTAIFFSVSETLSIGFCRLHCNGLTDILVVLARFATPLCVNEPMENHRYFSYSLLYEGGVSLHHR
jgi:hypothetical protein